MAPLWNIMIQSEQVLPQHLDAAQLVSVFGLTRPEWEYYDLPHLTQAY